MNERQLQEALSVLATGERTTDAVRLRALEMLADRPAQGAAAYELFDELAKLDDATLATERDQLLAAEIVLLATDETVREQHPRAWNALTQMMRRLSRSPPALPTPKEALERAWSSPVPPDDELPMQPSLEFPAELIEAQEAAEREREREELRAATPELDVGFPSDRQSRLRIDQ